MKKIMLSLAFIALFSGCPGHINENSIVVVAQKAGFTDTISNIEKARTRIPDGTWRKFDTVTETFRNFMGDKYDSGMSAIANISVRSEAEAVFVSNASGVSLTYIERTIFQPTTLQLLIFGPAWRPMQGRYPIEMWTELRERTNNGIRLWITGGNGTGVAHGQADGDLIWIVESGFFGAGAASGWGFNVMKDYHIGGGATIHCTPNSSDRSYVMTITIPLDDYYHTAGVIAFNADTSELTTAIAFNPVVSNLLKTSKFFKSDTFTMHDFYGRSQ
ncbi:MAG: hypothetical protein FWG89_06245 [Treponema sp.]|nr:hypothetical protein [Treponema sp.]